MFEVQSVSLTKYSPANIKNFNVVKWLIDWFFDSLIKPKRGRNNESISTLCMPHKHSTINMSGGKQRKLGRVYYQAYSLTHSLRSQEKLNKFFFRSMIYFV